MKRYILTKFNKIIDTNEYEIAQEKCLNGFVHFHKKANKNNTFSYMFRPADIIKESDNLMDLIKVGDIILFKLRLDTNFYGTVSLVFKNKCFVKCLPIDIYEESILKIFKPTNDNKHSLAWEREEE